MATDYTKCAIGFALGNAFDNLTTAVNVYKCEDGYVGICGVQMVLSDYMSAEDCGYPCYAIEYIEATTITYKPA